MPDPLTVLSVTSNIAQLLEQGIRLASHAHELARSGSLKEHVRLCHAASDFSSLSQKVATQCKTQVKLHSDPIHRQNEEKLLLELGDSSCKAATELATLLESLQIHKNSDDSGKALTSLKRKRDVAGKALKAIWKQKDVERLQRELGVFQQELSLRQGFMMFEQLLDCRKAVDGLILTAASNDLVIQRMANMMDQVEVATPVIRSLMYGEIYQREEDIPKAYSETFRWVFDRGTTGFSGWLESGSGIFWISGKAGCGKSTLMKYLIAHHSTRDLLNTWATNDKLVVAQHFFWIAGCSLQKSQSGLLRSLLLQILKHCPELAPVATPMRCGLRLQQTPWTQGELEESLRTIARQQTLSARICLFVDGLDEYDGHHTDIIQFLAELSRSPYIKICVASRPWNVFTSAYGCESSKTIKVQDLTETDIRTYVTGVLHQNPLFRELRDQEAGADELVEEITTKAEGVFLWVFLVVRNLLEGLIEGDDLYFMRHRVAEFPETLEGYFQRMLDSLHKVYRQESARILLSVMHWKPAGTLPLWVPLHLSAEVRDPDYAWTMPVTRDMYPAYETITRFVNARCRDLLEVIRYDKVQFFHRTVRDFLGTSDVHSMLLSRAGPSFNAKVSSMKARVAVLKSMQSDQLYMHHLLTGLFDDYVEMRQAGSLDTSSFGTAIAKLRNEVFHHKRFAWKSLQPGDLDHLRMTSTEQAELLQVEPTAATTKHTLGTKQKLMLPFQPVVVKWIAGDSMVIFHGRSGVQDQVGPGAQMRDCVIGRMNYQEADGPHFQAFTALGQALLLCVA